MTAASFTTWLLSETKGKKLESRQNETIGLRDNAAANTNYQVTNKGSENELIQRNECDKNPSALLCIVDSGGQARYAQRLIDNPMGDDSTQRERQARRGANDLFERPCYARL